MKSGDWLRRSAALWENEVKCRPEKSPPYLFTNLSPEMNSSKGSPAPSVEELAKKTKLIEEINDYKEVIKKLQAVIQALKK